MRRFARLIALLGVAAVAGLPLATLVCAQECAAPATTAASSEHCHQPEPSDTPALAAVPDEGCDSPFNLTKVAARDRAAAAVGHVASALAALHPRELLRPADRLTPLASRAPPEYFGVAVGTHVPLRI
jgi:hypothetical protein